MPVPGKAWRVTKTLLMILLIAALVASIILFGMAAFGSGLRLSVMIEDPLFSALYVLIAAIVMVDVVVRIDDKKQSQLQANGFQRRASHRLKSEAARLEILDFECRPSSRSALLFFRSGDVRPSKWRKYISGLSNFKGVKWDEEELAYFSPSSFQGKMTGVLFVCWPIIVLGWPIIVLHLFYLDVDDINVIGYAIFFLLSGGGVFHSLIFKKHYHDHGGTKKFALNRRTGLVTLYESGEEVFCHRFIDFNCYFKQEYFGGRTGWVRSLHMAYRNEDYPYDHVVNLATFVSNTSARAYLEVWEIIKCYMNTALPLPESLFLASRRPFDPTTAAYDSEHETSPLVTSNMSDSEFQHLLRKVDDVDNECRQTAY
ncbi:hypothetical protein EB809_12285 [Marinobacter sp. R17]|nr:hypothetical protein EB809_12285 [Marinobacter sp. R17]